MTAATDCIDQSRATESKRVARRNNSLSSTGRLHVFAFIFAVSVDIAAAFAYFGAWLILPFAGIGRTLSGAQRRELAQALRRRLRDAC